MKSFDELWIELTEKIAADDKSSKSVELAKSGVHAIGKKVLEEAGEVWIAAEYQSDDQLAEEISQLIYHLQVLMIARGLKPADIYRYL
jgi:phosphoribosyl-ATP pyrophosphohydrolase